MAFWKEKIEKGGPGISDMEKASWCRGEADSNIWNHWKPSDEPHGA
jgi:hypothetical protein